MIFCGCAADPRQAATAPPPAADPPGQDPRQAVAPLYIQCRHRQPIPGSRSPGGHGPPTARKEKRIKQFSFDPRQPIHPARIPGRPSRYYIFSAATGSRAPARLHGSALPPAADPPGQDPRQAVALLYIQCRHRQPIPGSRSPRPGSPAGRRAIIYSVCRRPWYPAADPRQPIHGRPPRSPRAPRKQPLTGLPLSPAPARLWKRTDRRPFRSGEGTVAAARRCAGAGSPGNG